MSSSHSSGLPASEAHARLSADAQDVTDAAPDWSFERLQSAFLAFLDTAEYLHGQSPATIRGYRCGFRSYATFLTSLPPDEQSHRLFDVDGWVRWLRKRGSANATSINTYFRQLKPFWRYLEESAGIPNPARGMRPPVLPTRLPKALRPEECRQILAAAEHADWNSAFERTRAVAIIATALYAGLRRKELLQLGFHDVDLHEGAILVRSGKGRGGGKDRVVYMAPELRDILARYIQERRRRRYDGPAFFSTEPDGGTMSLSTLSRIVKRVRRNSGVGFSLHRLRHSFVTMLLRTGVPIHVARDLAGHTQLSTTAGYLAVFDEDKRREVQRLSFRRR